MERKERTLTRGETGCHDGRRKTLAVPTIRRREPLSDMMGKRREPVPRRKES
jgi:hypothetical protein